MVEVTVHEPSVSLAEPVLVEGIPGVGLVGKIAADHLVNDLEPVRYAEVEGEELPDVAVFDRDDRGVKLPSGCSLTRTGIC